MIIFLLGFPVFRDKGGFLPYTGQEKGKSEAEV
jgi:hypothetical protein